MKLNEVTEPGYYQSLEDKQTIYEVIKNTDKEWLNETPEQKLLIDEWTFISVDFDDRAVYEICGGNLVAVQHANPVEVVKIKTKFTMTDKLFGLKMREDKPSYKEQVKGLKNKVKKYKKAANKYKSLLDNEIEQLKLSRREFLSNINVKCKTTTLQEPKLKNEIKETLKTFNSSLDFINRYKNRLDDLYDVCRNVLDDPDMRSVAKSLINIIDSIQE